MASGREGGLIREKGVSVRAGEGLEVGVEGLEGEVREGLEGEVTLVADLALKVECGSTDYS